MDNNKNNNENNLLEKTIKIGFIISSAILVLFFSMTLLYTIKGMCTVENKKSIFVIPAIIVWIVLIIISLYIINRYFDADNLRKSVIVISILMILPRIILMACVKVVQTSDFKLYMDVANSILNTLTAGEARNYLLSIANNVISISSIFAFWFSIVGNSLFSALLLNLLLFIGSGYLFYFICREITTNKNAFIATVIYVLWPEFIFYQLVVASEYLYMFFSMLGIYLFLKAFRYINNFKKLLILVAMGTFSLSMSNVIRPIGLVIIITCIIYAIHYYTLNKTKLFKIISVVATVMIIFVAVSSISNLWTEKIFKSKLSTMSWGWSLYEGTNTDTWGGWSAKTSKELDEVRNNTDDLSNVQKEMFKLAVERLKTYDTKTMLKLVKNKAVNMWGTNDHAVRTSIVEQDLKNSLIDLKAYESNLVTYSNNLWYGICGIFIIANTYFIVILIKKRSINEKILVFATPITGILLIHSMLTSIGRYKYPAIPFIIISVVYFIGTFLEKDKPLYK